MSVWRAGDLVGLGETASGRASLLAGDGWFVGLDLGQASDYTAAVVLERHGRPPGATFDVRDIARLPLGTTYPDVVDFVTEAVRRLAAGEPAGSPPRPVVLVVDATGVGGVVWDLLVRARPPARLVRVTITGGDAVTRGQGRDAYHVPKRDLIATALVLLQSGRLRIARSLPLAGTLVDELRAFRVTVTASGHDRYEAAADWRTGGAHDDLVLALAIACWAGAGMSLRPRRIVGYNPTVW